MLGFRGLEFRSVFYSLPAGLSVVALVRSLLIMVEEDTRIMYIVYTYIYMYLRELSSPSVHRAHGEQGGQTCA